jgi:hypothetical protein
MRSPHPWLLTMSDTPDKSAPAGSLTLAPEQVVSARAHWVSMGYSAEAFDQAASGAPVGADAPFDAPPVQVLSDLKAPVIDQGQAHDLAATLIAAGVPEAEVQAALAADGFAPALEDTRTDDQKEFDAAFGGAKPSEYRVDYMGRIPADMDPAELAAFDTVSTTWASEVGFPADLGAAVLERAMDVGQSTRRMANAERELFKREQAVVFERQAGGPEKAAERMKLAGHALARGGREFTDLLHKAGALDDAWTVLTLANQAERLAAR